MSHATARRIRRANPNRARSLPMQEFIAFVTTQGVPFSVSPTRNARANHALHSVRHFGSFISATFSHPTKAASAGRTTTVSWRTPGVTR